MKSVSGKVYWKPTSGDLVALISAPRLFKVVQEVEFFVGEKIREHVV